MKGSKTTHSRSRRQKIRAYLKRVVLNEKIVKLTPFTVIVLDLLDDGQVNGSLIAGMLN